jgi:hypothetical protein
VVVDQHDPDAVALLVHAVSIATRRSAERRSRHLAEGRGAFGIERRFGGRRRAADSQASDRDEIASAEGEEVKP